MKFLLLLLLTIPVFAATPYMGLVLPTPGVTLGPTYAEQNNTAFTTIDSHDHSTGKGAPIIPSSIDMSTDLSFNEKNATDLRAARFTSQSAALALGSDVGEIYNLNGNPTWNNNSGTASRLVNSSFPMSAGDILYATNSTSWGRLGIGTAGQSLHVSGSSLPQWSSSTNTSTVTSKTANYTVTGSDDVILVNDTSGSFSLTLPLSTGGGKSYQMKKTNSTLGSSVTVVGAGSDMIQDVSTARTTTLNTQGEDLQILDAATGTWQILQRKVPSQTIAFTPTGGWSVNTTYTGFWQRIGDSARVQIYVALSGAPVGSLTLNMPSGMVINTAKLLNSAGSAQSVLGRLHIFDNSAQRNIDGMVTFNSSSAVSISGLITDEGYGYTTGLAQVNATTPVTFESGDSVYVEFTVPIVGWN